MSTATPPPAAPAAPANSAPTLRELTLRGVIIGGLITLIFTAANVYLGLKVGLTFATSIPAAVISMAVLRRFDGHNVRENNIVQTIASAAGTLSAIIFVLPGLVMIGYWQGFPFWTTAAVCALGGILGVMFSVPLRRALVTGSDLPYPEGVAAAEVLRVGDTEAGATEEDHRENEQGLHVIIIGAITSAAYALLAATKAVASEVSGVFRFGRGGTMLGGSLSLALIGVGHLVGLTVGIAMLVGVVISYFILLPLRSGAHMDEGLALADAVSQTFSSEIRFIGVGTMAVAALWTLVKITKPVVSGVSSSLASSRKRHSGEEVDITERDVPFQVVALVILGSMLPIGFVLWDFLRGTDIADHSGKLVVLSVLFILVIGLIIASVCGYMAGLIGASNSPISSVGIIAVLACSLLIAAVMRGTDANPTSLVAYTLFTAAVVFGIATISNDNLQDLKTGQLVGATPWKQQVALIIGVLFGSIVIPPILQVMLDGFGFQGMEGAGPDALAAPQAALMSSVATGIFDSTLDWGLIGTGAAIGVVLIVIDEVLTRATGGKRSLPPLAVGMGMYLPIAVTVIVPIGGFIGWAYNKWAAKQLRPEFAKRMGTLAATGLIVGESLFGVVNAGIIAAAAGENPLAIFSGGSWTPWVSMLVFAACAAGVYYATRKRVDAPADSGADVAASSVER